MANPILEISNGTTSVSLIEGKGGFGVADWRPAIAPSKGGGIWQNSPMADGRRLVIHHFDNAIETFNLTLNSGNMDSVIEKGQKLRRLLQDARDYWVSNRNDAPPVYIKARAPNETNTRYALIYDWQTPNDANPFTTPFFGCGDSAMPDLTLVVERGHWMSDAPLYSTCVQVSNQQAYEEANASSGAFSQTYDVNGNYDGYSEDGDSTGNNLAGSIMIGPYDPLIGDEQKYFSALRFRNIYIPAHATITSAFVRFVAESSSTARTITAGIYAEKVQSPPPFDPYGPDNLTPLADRMASVVVTDAYVSWNIPQLTAGNSYDTASLVSILQEMVDTSFWLNGDNLVLYFYNDQSIIVPHTDDRKMFESFNIKVDPTPTAPVLHVEYSVPSTDTYGQEASCNAGTVFVANKHNRANISHIYRYDASIASYSANLVTATLPYDLLPATPAVNDIVYFGIDTSLQNSGPFSSLVFDISEISEDVHGNWQYYNGTTVGWEDLSVTDNTVDVVYEDSFTVLGINSVHWIQHYQWEAITINGVEAYWVRFIVTSIDSAPDSPRQQNRIPYSIVTPFVDIDAAQVGGDIAALSSIYIQNMSDDGLYDVKLQAKRVIAALRTLDRGANFSPYLNVAGGQNLIQASFQSLVPEFTFDPIAYSPTGLVGNFVVATTFSMAAVSEIIFQGDELTNYIGTFRAFLRTRLHAGDISDVTARISMTFGEENANFYTDEVAVESAAMYAYSLTDLGLFTIQPGTLNPNENYQSGKIQLFLANNGTGTINLHVTDLILMPADEWFCDTFSQTDECLRMFGWHGIQRELRIDAIGNPRLQLRSLLCSDENGVALDTWQVISNSPPILQANKDQRLWFLVHDTDRDVPDTCSFEAVHAIRVFKSQRYFSMRGGR